MTISNSNERFTFVIDKSLKYKLQMLSDSEDRKLGSYISKVLEDHIREFEFKILDLYGEKDFLHEYHGLFGHEHPPLISPNPQDDNNPKKVIERIKRGSRSAPSNSLGVQPKSRLMKAIIRRSKPKK